jgi:hypothetical protein
VVDLARRTHERDLFNRFGGNCKLGKGITPHLATAPSAMAVLAMRRRRQIRVLG